MAICSLSCLQRALPIGRRTDLLHKVSPPHTGSPWLPLLQANKGQAKRPIGKVQAKVCPPVRQQQLFQPPPLPWHSARQWGWGGRIWFQLARLIPQEQGKSLTFALRLPGEPAQTDSQEGGWLGSCLSQPGATGANTPAAPKERPFTTTTTTRHLPDAPSHKPGSQAPASSCHF